MFWSRVVIISLTGSLAGVTLPLGLQMERGHQDFKDGGGDNNQVVPVAHLVPAKYDHVLLEECVKHPQLGGTSWSYPV